MAKLMMISADSHAAMNPADYATWLDPVYRDAATDLVKYTKLIESLTWEAVPDLEALQTVDSRGALRSGGKEGLWNPARRVAELETEGFVAEILFPADRSSQSLFFSNLNEPHSPEYRAAGCKAHNRWLSEYCSYAPGRLFGVAQMEPWPDMQACVREIHWARQAGLGAIGLPRFTGIEPNQPSLTSDAWDPFWRACVENDFAVCVHIGHNVKQGTQLPYLLTANLPVHGAPDPAKDGDIHYDPGRRPLWQVILSGVFDRFPSLRITFSELRTEWVAPTLAHLEARFDAIRFGEHGLKPPKLRPSDYWHRNCAVAGQLRPYEMALRHQIGVGTVMFGVDYPHSEGSWPNSREWLRVALKGVSESEARMVLGENAARIYGLDTATLEPHVKRVGLEPWELLGDHEVSPELVQNLQWRASFLGRAYRYDPDPVDRIMEEDERSLAKLR
jgi:predicted TIM-barrel fold metal-dependent hydrolase